MKKRILVVDDEAKIGEMLADFLNRSDYEVTAVQSAIEAEEAIRRSAPQLVISDLQLEDSDGLEMIDRLKAALPGTPVMLLTGVLFDPKVVRDVLSKKVSSYLPKTSTLARILKEVQSLIGP